jgi:hypothetical protein
VVPTTALDLGAKAKYIISVNPTSKAAGEACEIYTNVYIQAEKIFGKFSLIPYNQ